MIFVSIFTRRLPDSAVWPIRIFVFFWIVVSAWCARFVFAHGMLYVSLTFTPLLGMAICR
jgi:hypothetical protein